MLPEEDLDRLASEGFLPTGVNADDHVVSLARLARSGFHEVWYDDTAAKADGQSRQVPFRAFTEQFADRRDNEQLRLIGHTSRCGSTLLANLLALRPATMVLNEPDFVTIPVRRIALAAGGAEAQTFGSLLRALLNFTCHAAAAAGRVSVIKLTSWTVPVVVASLGRREDTSWLFLWADPGKMVASNVAKHPSWGKDTENGRAAARLTGIDGIMPGTVKFYANIWCRIVDSFQPADGKLRSRTLGYQDLSRDKAAALLAAEKWFDLTSDTGLPADFEQESTRYSKGSPAEKFEPVKSHLRSPLDQHEIREVGAITKRSLDALRGEKSHRLL